MIRHIRYFYKLLFSFLLIGLLPLVTLGILFYVFSTNIVRTMYMDRALTTITEIGAGMDALIDGYRNIVLTLGSDATLKAALTPPHTENRSVSTQVYRKIYLALSGKLDTAALFLVSADGEAVYSTRPLPMEYDPSTFGGWGVLGRIRENDSSPLVYGQRHELGEPNDARLSVGLRINEKDGSTAGFLIVDVFRPEIFDVLNRTNGSFFTGLNVYDSNHFTLFNLKNPHEEGSFVPPADEEYRKEREVSISESILIAYAHAADGRLTVRAEVPMAPLMSSFSLLRSLTILLSVLSFFVCLALSFLLSRSISEPVGILVSSMERIEKGELTVQLDNSRSDEIGMLFDGYNRMVIRIRALVKDIINEHRRLRTAELKALQAQINPHFLYNTLNTIKSIAKLRRVDEIGVIVTHLGKLLRNSINNDKEMSTLEESISLVNSYLEIQRFRYGNKIGAIVRIPDGIMDCVLPKLVLQPIVENSVVHGLEKKVGGGTVSIDGREENGSLVITVSDDGVGIPRERLETLFSHEHDRATESIGLENIRERLELYYGNEGNMKIESRPGEGTTVTIRIPRTDGHPGT